MAITISQPATNTYYNIAFVNPERWLVKSRVSITQCKHGKFPALTYLYIPLHTFAKTMNKNAMNTIRWHICYMTFNNSKNASAIPGFSAICIFTTIHDQLVILKHFGGEFLLGEPCCRLDVSVCFSQHVKMNIWRSNVSKFAVFKTFWMRFFPRRTSLLFRYFRINVKLCGLWRYRS